jgi:hypothetical protein
MGSQNNLTSKIIAAYNFGRQQAEPFAPIVAAQSDRYNIPDQFNFLDLVKATFMPIHLRLNAVKLLARDPQYSQLEN